MSTKEKLPRLSDVYRGNPNTKNNIKLARRQIPLIVDDNLTLVMDFRGSNIISENGRVPSKQLEEFVTKWVKLTQKELQKALQITKAQLMSVLTQSLPCVGCRRSVERIYDQLHRNCNEALDPLVIRSDGTILIKSDKLIHPHILCSMFNGHTTRLGKLLENQPKKSKNSFRCLLHSLDSQRNRPLTPIWRDVWECMHADVRKDVCIIDAHHLHCTLETYLRKHRFCGDCRTKVLRAYSLLAEEPEPCKEQGYVSSLYTGIRRCLNEKHIHLPPKTEYITKLIGRAEPELTGSRRERHAKTLEIAQEEVLCCLGICIYERLHRIYMRMREEEFTCQLFSGIAVDVLCSNFEAAVEDKQGFSQLELLFAEFAKEEQEKQLRKEQKKLRRRRKKFENAGREMDQEEEEDEEKENNFDDCGDEEDDSDEKEDSMMMITGKDCSCSQQQQQPPNGKKQHDQIGCCYSCENNTIGSGSSSKTKNDPLSLLNAPSIGGGNNNNDKNNDNKSTSSTSSSASSSSSTTSNSTSSSSNMNCVCPSSGSSSKNSPTSPSNLKKQQKDSNNKTTVGNSNNNNSKSPLKQNDGELWNANSVIVPNDDCKCDKSPNQSKSGSNGKTNKSKQNDSSANNNICGGVYNNSSAASVTKTNKNKKKKSPNTSIKSAASPLDCDDDCCQGDEEEEEDDDKCHGNEHHNNNHNHSNNGKNKCDDVSIGVGGVGRFKNAKNKNSGGGPGCKGGVPASCAGGTATATGGASVAGSKNYVGAGVGGTTAVINCGGSTPASTISDHHSHGCGIGGYSTESNNNNRTKNGGTVTCCGGNGSGGLYPSNSPSPEEVSESLDEGCCRHQHHNHNHHHHHHDVTDDVGTRRVISNNAITDVDDNVILNNGGGGCRDEFSDGQHRSLREMLDGGFTYDDEDDSKWEITPEEVREFEKNNKHLMEQRQELREALQKRFIYFCAYGPLQMPRLLVQSKYASN